uniref:Glutathione S-transferase C-terminal domain-containing protein-like n=1 Tax=Sinocyclocheilus anshuiensis TaxID=1608454 RepID=A0A671RZV5_9TELE
MKQTEPQKDRESLYLEVTTVNGAVSFPLHSSIVLFLLSYTECSSFHVYLVTDQVSQWTRLCELDIPSTVDRHLQNPEDQMCRLPAAILNLEKRLGEPVKVHNDDKICRQKLQQQKKGDSQLKGPNTETESHPNESHPGVELTAALAKLSADAVLAPSTRERSDIRKVKTTDLPELEHVFAEGLYFTLTDVVLLPCVHQYLISLQKHTPSTLSHLPLLLRWYQRVKELPSVLRATKDCGMALLSLSTVDPCPPQPEALRPSGAEQEGPKLKQEPFVGGPRPTLSKLQENGIDAVYAAHPCPSWTVDWESLPAAVNPTEGNLGQKTSYNSGW